MKLLLIFLFLKTSPYPITPRLHLRLNNTIFYKNNNNEMLFYFIKYLNKLKIKYKTLNFIDLCEKSLG